MNSQSSRTGALESAGLARNPEALSTADSKRVGRTSSSISETGAPVYEAQYVHAIYEQIAPHFSATRYKASPPLTEILAAELDAFSALACSIPLPLLPASWEHWA
jgi:hypothetical protein